MLTKYADGIGPDYHMLINENSKPGKIKLTTMVKDAHKNKLVVHPYTILIDKLPNYVKNVQQLFDIIYNKANVDGAFTDFPDLGIKFLQKQHQHQ
ncbi:Glycerophosphoryl diester phosphodiesterase [Arsenophonus endosymbiont of Bemisia tabaci Q2]|nr:Glycerophosphoryl diester phosphodiesterase [Arsenophonus endosymbiont of Bemisia tabaci Q2]